MSDTAPLLLANHVLDHQMVAADDTPVAKVDDLILEELRPGEAPYVTGILTGQIAFGHRLRGRLGEWIAAVGARLRGHRGTEPRRLDITHVKDVGHTVVLRLPSHEISEPELEQWLADHVVGRIPGARR